MNCMEIENALNDLKVNARGSIRGKNKIIDKLYSMHLTKLDDELMNIRVFVARLSTGHSTKEALKMMDDFIYKKQIGA